MLKINRLKQQLIDGGQVIGLFASIPSPVTVETIGHAGFDFVILDTEHTLVNPETLENMLRTAELVGLTALVRVAGTDPQTLIPILDGGAQGIALANVQTPEALAALVETMRFHPLGRRSMNGGRPARFGADNLVDYVARANSELMIVPMIETQAGLDNLDAILAVPGIDMLLEGAADLSQSMGQPWQTEAPAVTAALEALHARCREADVPFCAIPRTPNRRAYWQARGVNAFVLGDERGIAFRALQAKVRPYRQDWEQHGASPDGTS